MTHTHCRQNELDKRRSIRLEWFVSEIVAKWFCSTHQQFVFGYFFGEKEKNWFLAARPLLKTGKCVGLFSVFTSACTCVILLMPTNSISDAFSHSLSLYLSLYSVPNCGVCSWPQAAMRSRFHAYKHTHVIGIRTCLVIFGAFREIRAPWT